MNPPLLVAIESADARSRGIQAKLLSERLRAVGYDVEVLNFPLGQDPKAPAAPISPSTNPYRDALDSSLEYSKSANIISNALEDGFITIVTGYLASSLASNIGRFDDPAQQVEFASWLQGVAYQLLGTKKPDRSFLLDVAATTSAKPSRLESAYHHLALAFPSEYNLVPAVEGKQPLSIPAVNNRLWDDLKPLLPEKPTNKAKARRVQIDKEDHLKAPEPPVEPKPESKPAAKEAKATKPDKPSQPSRPSANDRSKEAFAGVSLAAALPFLQSRSLRSTLQRPWFFTDQKIKTNYRSFEPAKLSKELSREYQEGMEHIAKLYEDMQQPLVEHYHLEGLNRPEAADKAYDTLSAIIPFAARVDIEVAAAEKSLAHLGQKFLVSDLPELQMLAKRLTPAQPPSVRAEALQQLESVAEGLSGSLSDDKTAVRLVNVIPRSELDSAANFMHPYSDLSLRELEWAIENWSYDQKAQIISLASASDSRSLEDIHYSWELVTDFLTLHKFLGNRFVNNLVIQQPSPRFGYDVPAAIEAANLTDQYLEAFDISLRLHSQLQAAKRTPEAIYTVLQGHKLRWSVSYNARAARTIERSVSGDDSNYAKLIDQLREKRAEVHPLIVTSGVLMRSLNRGSKDSQPDKADDSKESGTPAKSSARRRRRRRR